MDEIFIDQVSSDVIDKDYLNKFYTDQSFEVTFVYKSEFNNAKYLRSYLSIILDILSVNSLRKNRFILIMDELNNNAIEYGTVEWWYNFFRFISKENDGKLSINLEVEDQWNSQTSKKAIEMEYLRLCRLNQWFDKHGSIRWRWLFLIITKLVDNLYFKDSSSWWLIVWTDKILEKK